MLKLTSSIAIAALVSISTAQAQVKVDRNDYIRTELRCQGYASAIAIFEKENEKKGEWADLIVRLKADQKTCYTELSLKGEIIRLQTPAPTKVQSVVIKTDDRRKVW